MKKGRRRNHINNNIDACESISGAGQRVRAGQATKWNLTYTTNGQKGSYFPREIASDLWDDLRLAQG